MPVRYYRPLPSNIRALVSHDVLPSRNMPDLSTNVYCFYIAPSQDPGDEGYIPSVVVQDEPGHFPLSGRGDGAAPWRWGKTLKEAEETCRQQNAKRGITDDMASDIVASSMRTP